MTAPPSMPSFNFNGSEDEAARLGMAAEYHVEHLVSDEEPGGFKRSWPDRSLKASEQSDHRRSYSRTRRFAVRFLCGTVSR